MSTSTTSRRAATARPLGLIARGVLVALIIGGGIAVLALAAAVSLSTWVRTQPEPATLLFGDSMPPTLQDFDVAWLRFPDHLRRGDIISYRVDGSRISHRIVGLPGETVQIAEGRVLVGRGGDLHPLHEPYVQHTAPAAWDAPATTLGPSQYLTLGDNRARPSGRAAHVVDRGDIIGVLYRVVFPPWRVRTLEPPGEGGQPQ